MVLIETSFSDVICTQRYEPAQKKQLMATDIQSSDRQQKRPNTQPIGKSFKQMTIIFFKINGDTFILRGISYDSTTESFDLKTEAVETGIQTTFKCPKGSEHYSFKEGLYKNTPPAEIKSKKRIV